MAKVLEEGDGGEDQEEELPVKPVQPAAKRVRRDTRHADAQTTLLSPSSKRASASPTLASLQPMSDGLQVEGVLAPSTVYKIVTTQQSKHLTSVEARVLLGKELATDDSQLLTVLVRNVDEPHRGYERYATHLYRSPHYTHYFRAGWHKLLGRGRWHVAWLWRPRPPAARLLCRLLANSKASALQLASDSPALAALLPPEEVLEVLERTPLTPLGRASPWAMQHRSRGGAGGHEEEGRGAGGKEEVGRGAGRQEEGRQGTGRQGVQGAGGQEEGGRVRQGHSGQGQGNEGDECGGRGGQAAAGVPLQGASQQPPPLPPSPPPPLKLTRLLPGFGQSSLIPAPPSRHTSSVVQQPPLPSPLGPPPAAGPAASGGGPAGQGLGQLAAAAAKLGGGCECRPGGSMLLDGCGGRGGEGGEGGGLLGRGPLVQCCLLGWVVGLEAAEAVQLLRCREGVKVRLQGATGAKGQPCTSGSSREGGQEGGGPQGLLEGQAGRSYPPPCTPSGGP
ncbi:hypothetical protein V8C86DRAFT_3132818 [Haematococcus lacustris]